MVDPFIFTFLILSNNKSIIRTQASEEEEEKKECINIHPYVHHKESINIYIDTSYIALRKRLRSKGKNKYDNRFLINRLSEQNYMCINRNDYVKKFYA